MAAMFIFSTIVPWHNVCHIFRIFVIKHLGISSPTSLLLLLLLLILLLLFLENGRR